MNPVRFHYPSGKIKEEHYIENKKHHRLDGPAIIYYYESGQIELEKYFINNKLHRLDKPACIYYYESGKIKTEAYFENNELHRLNGPAHIEYHQAGNRKLEIYFMYGKRCRYDGPAQIEYLYHNKFTLRDERYFINDIHLTNFSQYIPFRIFDYIKYYPHFIKEVEILVRYNKWLNEEQILSLRTLALFT